MSTSENRFIRWFGTIATALIIASIIGIIGMYYTSGILATQKEVNGKEIEEVREFHKDDVELIRQSMRDIRNDQKVIKSDIKDILKAVK